MQATLSSADIEPLCNVLTFPKLRSEAQLGACPTFQRVANADLIDDRQRLDIECLRWFALRSRLAPKPDLERACLLLAVETSVTLQNLSIAFFRGLIDHTRRPMVFYRPATHALSDDELWLVRVVSAWRRKETSAAAALIAWRVAPAGQRWMRYLSAEMTTALDAAF